VNYADLRAANSDVYQHQYPRLWGALGYGWGPLGAAAAQMQRDPQALFNAIHDAGIQAIAAQQDQVDWSQTYAAVKPLLDSPVLIAAIQDARWELATSVAERDDSLTLTKEHLARHVREAFARDGLQHLTRIRHDARESMAVDPSTLLATIITAVLGVLCPPTAGFSGILEPIIAVIIRILFAGLTTQFANGTYGLSPDAFNAQVQLWAKESLA
jgi:hypothetical protein